MLRVIDKNGNEFRIIETNECARDILKYVNCFIPEEAEYLLTEKELENILITQCPDPSLREVIVKNAETVSFLSVELKIEGAPILEDNLRSYNSYENKKEVLKYRSQKHFNNKGEDNDENN